MAKKRTKAIPKPSDNSVKNEVMEPEVAPDPFDLKALRLPQDYASSIGVKKVLNVVPVRKPNRQEFVRVRPGTDWRLETALFEDKIGREIYLVAPDMRGELISEAQPHCLRLAITRQGVVFLWALKLPGADGRSNPWNESAIQAATLAETTWMRVTANMAGGLYDAFAASVELSPPEWPDLSFQEILKLAFRDRFIRDGNHPILQSLRGEV